MHLHVQRFPELLLGEFGFQQLQVLVGDKVLDFEKIGDKEQDHHRQYGVKDHHRTYVLPICNINSGYRLGPKDGEDSQVLVLDEEEPHEELCCLLDSEVVCQVVDLLQSEVRASAIVKILVSGCPSERVDRVKDIYRPIHLVLDEYPHQDGVDRFHEKVTKDVFQSLYLLLILLIEVKV